MHSYSQCCKVLFIQINILFLKDIKTFIQQECIKLIKSESKHIMSQKMTNILSSTAVLKIIIKL